MNLRTNQRDDIVDNEQFVKLVFFLGAQRAFVFLVWQFADSRLRLVRKMKLANLLSRWPTPKERRHLFDEEV
jgi:hypothetical protein